MEENRDVAPGSDHRDTCVLAGLLGEHADLEAFLATLKASETRRLDAERDVFEAEGRQWETEREALFARREANGKEITALQEVLTETLDSAKELERRESELRASRANSVSVLIARRATYPARAVTERARMYWQLRTEISGHEVDEHRRLLEYQKQFLAIERERRELNEPEFRRRTLLLQEQQAAARAKLVDHEHLIARLRCHGITRTTSGFLLWSGYLSFGALGWLLGETIRIAHSSGASPLQALLARLAGGIGALVSSLGVVSTVGLLLLLPPVTFVLLGLLFWQWDRFLTKFDTAWTDRGGQRKRRPGVLNVWLSSTGPGIDRSHYVEFLAKLPLLFTWSLLPLCVAVLPAVLSTSSGSAQAVAWDSFLYTYAGIVAVITATGVAMLYVTNIVQPRILQDSSNSMLRGLFCNLELALTSLAAVSVFLLYPFLQAWVAGLPKPWDPNHGLAVAVLGLMVSFGTAYGLVFHGQFKDLDALRQEVRRFDDELQRYTSVPTIEFSEEQAERFRHSLRALYADIDRLWALPTWQSLLLGVSGADRDTRRRWYFGRKQSERDGLGLLTFSSLDVLLEPELVGTLRERDVTLDHMRTQRHEAADREQRLRTRIAQVRDIEAALLRDEQALLDKQRERERQHHLLLDGISRDLARRTAEAKVAFDVGRSLRTGPAPSGSGLALSLLGG